MERQSDMSSFPVGRQAARKPHVRLYCDITSRALTATRRSAAETRDVMKRLHGVAHPSSAPSQRTRVQPLQLLREKFCAKELAVSRRRDRKFRMGPRPLFCRGEPSLKLGCTVVEVVRWDVGRGCLPHYGRGLGGSCTRSQKKRILLLR